MATILSADEARLQSFGYVHRWALDWKKPGVELSFPLTGRPLRGLGYVHFGVYLALCLARLGST